MIVGFTATRNELNKAQIDWIYDELALIARSYRDELEFHHGDCIGGDVKGHEIAKQLGYKTFAHPSTIPYLRAHCNADVVYPPVAPLQRDKIIVVVSNRLLAVPGYPESRRSGTWATVRFARKSNVPISLCELWDAS